MSKDITKILRECQEHYLRRPVTAVGHSPTMSEMGPEEALYTANSFGDAIAEIERLRASAKPRGVLEAIIVEGPNKGRTLGECLMHGLYVEQSTKWGTTQ